jgi:hypothetical protein
VLFDVLGSAGAEATPMWSEAPHHNDPNRPPVDPVDPGVIVQPPPPPPPNCDGWIARVADLEREVERLKREGPKPTIDYDAMYAMVQDANAAYVAGSLGRSQHRPAVMPPGTVMHLCWGFFYEGRTRDALIEEARKRGNNEPFD